MDFTGYFLIVADFINWARSTIPVGPGRGSGAGSIVAYAMRITRHRAPEVQPPVRALPEPRPRVHAGLRRGLLLRTAGRVIDYVTEKYGEDRVGQIITFGTLKAKAVIKDTARALDIPYEEANMIAKLVPEDPKMTLKKAFEEEAR
jgi:DNA polymerase-3 subunit alpha